MERRVEQWRQVMSAGRVWWSFFLVLMMIVVGTVLAYVAQLIFLQRAEHQFGKEAEAAKVLVDGYLKTSVTTNQKLIQDPRLVSYFSQETLDPTQADALAKDLFLSNSTYRRLSLIDAQGVPVGAYPLAERPFQSIADREYFKMAASLKKTVVSDALVPRALPSLTPIAVYLSSPVVNDQGEVIGVVVGALDLSKLESNLQSLVALGQSRYVITDTRDHSFIHYDQAELGKSGELNSEFVAKASQSNNVEYGYGKDGRLFLEITHEIAPAGWRLMVQQPYQVMLEQAATIGFLVLLGTVFIGLLAIGATDEITSKLK